MSLRLQINLRILVSMIVILIIGGSIAIWRARNAVIDEVQSSVNIALQLIQSGLSQPLQTSYSYNSWLVLVTSLQETRHLKIRIEDAAGQDVFITNKYRLLDKREVPPKWFVSAVSAEYPKTDYQIPDADGRLMKITVQAEPLDEITEAWEETLSFVMSIFIMTLMIFLAVNLVFNTALKSVAVILGRLKDIENGNYQKRPSKFSILEFEYIAGAINHMAETLDKANRENSKLTLHSLEIQEEERQRLSQELHDELGQSLSAIKAMAVTSKRKGVDIEKISDSITSVCDHLFSVVRSMMRNLHPIILSELGLKATLEDLVDYWSLRHPDIKFQMHCQDAVDLIDKKLTIQIFRVMQECLTNIVRHADAQEVFIGLEIIDDTGPGNNCMIQLSVKDDGIGCNMNDISSGFGLLGMKERIKGLSGELIADSRPGGGMTIAACIPFALNNPADE